MSEYLDQLLDLREQARVRFQAAYHEIIAWEIQAVTKEARLQLRGVNKELFIENALRGHAKQASRVLSGPINWYGDAVAKLSLSAVDGDSGLRTAGIIEVALDKETTIAGNMALRNIRDALTFGGENFAASEFEKIMESWTSQDVGRAGRAVVQADGDIARAVWRSQGITSLQWNIAGDTCDACTGLDGAIVGIEGAFLAQGSNTGDDPEGKPTGQGKIWAGSDVLHPPLHANCDCYITPISGFRSGVSMKKEIRISGSISIKKRADQDDGKMIVEGEAAVFNTPEELWPGHFEQILPGTFARTLRGGADVRMNFNHDSNFVLARIENGTLVVWETDKALMYRAELNPKDPQAVSVYEKIQRRDVSQSSFMFSIPEGGDSVEDVEGGRLWSIRDADLHDVAPVTYPAYTQTSVSARTKQRRSAGDGRKATGEARASPVPVSVRIRQRTDQLKEIQLNKKGNQ